MVGLVFVCLRCASRFQAGSYIKDYLFCQYICCVVSSLAGVGLLAFRPAFPPLVRDTCDEQHNVQSHRELACPVGEEDTDDAVALPRRAQRTLLDKAKWTM